MIALGSSVAFAACCMSDWFGIFATFAALRLNWEDADQAAARGAQSNWRFRPIPDIQRCSMLTHQLAQTGHSSMAQHFREANDRSADKVPMCCATRTTEFKTH